MTRYTATFAVTVTAYVDVPDADAADPYDADVWDTAPSYVFDVIDDALDGRDITVTDVELDDIIPPNDHV